MIEHNLIEPMKRAIQLISINGLAGILGQEIHMSPLYIEHIHGQSVIPIVEFENEVFFEKNNLNSRKRRDVFQVGDLIFKSGEISTLENPSKKEHSRNDPLVIERANLNVSMETTNRFNNPESVQPVAFLVYDRVNEVKFSVEEKALTLEGVAESYHPSKGEAPLIFLEQAAVRLYSKLERNGKVYVPQRTTTGKIDLGDILVGRTVYGSVELKLTDNPLIVSADNAPIDNVQSFMQMLSAFYDAITNKVAKLDGPDVDISVFMRRMLSERRFYYSAGESF